LTHSLRFAHVEIRPVERLVLIDGKPAPLGTRAFDLLMVLVEQRQRVVSHDELLDAVWPGLVVEVNNVQVQISSLRKLLGPQAIATIPGRGYRFTMPLDGPGAEPADVPAGAAAPHASGRRPPALATTLVGRDDDLAALGRLLDAQRLLTVVGAPGIGKTTLVLAAAHQRQGGHPDGIAWVDLAALADPALLPSAVAQAAGLPVSAADDALASLVRGLAPAKLLLVLDNAEHLLAATARLVQAVMAAAAELRVLVTSQAPLKIDGEWVFRLDALSVPADGTAADQAMNHGAVALFALRAAAADRRFVLTAANVGVVITLCRGLDGIPLALQLAAARLPLLGLQGVVARLGDRLQLLRGGGRDAPTRQHTVLAALDWSHGLLDAAEQAVLRRLGVFAGGFTLELASAVACDAHLDAWAVIDVLGALVDRSLVAIDGGDAGDAPRYRLPESVRAYAGLKLDEANERPALQSRHAEALTAAFDAAYEAYWSTPDRPWLAAWAPEIDNVRAALDWGVEHNSPVAVSLVGSACPLFLLLGLAAEGRKRFSAVEALVAAQPPSPTVARYWLERGRLNWGISNTDMRDQALLAAERYRASADTRGLYLALRCAVGSSALAADQTRLFMKEMAGLERPGWPARLHAQRKMAEVSLLQADGRLAEARTACEALLTLATHAGLDLVASATLSELAGLNLSLGDLDAAQRCAQTLTTNGGRRQNNFVVRAHATLAQASLALGHMPQARQAMADLLAASRSRDWEWFGAYADLYALFAAREGRLRAAARLVAYADAAARTIGDRGANMAAARTQAGALVEAGLKPRELARLAAEGALADVEAVCGLTLAEAAD
jgi:predicted ATPase/DNA-binding winged helix-turn-helix (wHTH) protein